MSTNTPGIIYDATNSWNGYNHQGKISIWYAISEIIKLYDASLSETENKAILENYFLEIEHMEDFSIGKMENGTTKYISVHQVKSHSNRSIEHYESAVLGLVAHLINNSEIELALLHTTEEINLNGESFLDIIKRFTSNPQYLIKDENLIITNRDKVSFRNELTAIKRGRPKTFKSNLIRTLENKYSCEQKLTESNLDEAFDLYLCELKKEKGKIRKSPEELLKKVSLCDYNFAGKTAKYCSVDNAENFLKNVIKDFYQKVYPGSYKAQDEFVKKSYIWVLGKLDSHIIERDLHYDLYTKNILDRRIPLSTLFDWLTSSEIDMNGDWYYIQYIKEQMFSKIERYCKVCTKDECATCNVVECKNQLGTMSFENFKSFIHMTNPTVSGKLDMNSYAKYLGNGIENPFAKGLRDIPKGFDAKNNAISYKDNDKIQCALTTILGAGTDNDKALISSDILANSNIYDLLMDYDCLISRDINIPSIKDEEILQLPCFDSKQSDHIAHCKNVKIVPLDDFINQL